MWDTHLRNCRGRLGHNKTMTRGRGLPRTNEEQERGRERKDSKAGKNEEEDEPEEDDAEENENSDEDHAESEEEGAEEQEDEEEEEEEEEEVLKATASKADDQSFSRHRQIVATGFAPKANDRVAEVGDWLGCSCPRTNTSRCCATMASTIWRRSN